MHEKGNAVDSELHLRPSELCSPCLAGREKMLQELCKEIIGWDDPVPAKLKVKWETYLCCKHFPFRMLQAKELWSPDQKGITSLFGCK